MEARTILYSPLHSSPPSPLLPPPAALISVYEGAMCSVRAVASALSASLVSLVVSFQFTSLSVSSISPLPFPVEVPLGGLCALGGEYPFYARAEHEQRARALHLRVSKAGSPRAVIEDFGP